MSVLEWGGVHLTSSQPDWSSNTVDHKISLVGYIWPKVSLTQSLTKCQPDQKPDPVGYNWPKVSLTKDLTKMSTWLKAWSWGVHLTKDQPDPKIWQKCQSDPKTHLQGVHLTKGHPDLKSDQMSTWPKAWSRGTSDQRSAWPEDLTKMSTWPKDSSMRGYIWPKINLSQSDQMSTWPKAWSWGFTSDPKIWQKCQLDSAWPKDLTKMSTWPMPHLWGSIWLSAEGYLKIWTCFAF